MPFPAKLEGGTLITRDPNRKVSPHVEPAYVRLFGALDLYLSVACVVLFRQACLLTLGNPDSPWAEVAVREVWDTKYILIVPTDEKNPKKVKFSQATQTEGLLIRTADDVLLDAGIAMVPGYTYKLEAALVPDVTYQHVVVADWTHAAQEAQEKSKK